MGERAGRPPARRSPQAGPKPVAGPVSADMIVVVGKWTGGSAAALRAALRDAIDGYAERLGVGVSTAGDWEDKPDVVPHPVNQQALDEVLRRADDEARRRFDVLTQGDPHVRVADLSQLNGNGVGTDRRRVTKGAVAAGLAAALAPLEALERTAAQGAHPVDSGLASAHEKLEAALAGLHRSKRPDELVGEVARQADELLELLDRPMAEADRRRVEAVAAGSCAHAGMLAFDTGDRRLARGCFALARSVAEDSGNDVLRGRALGVGAILLSPMPGGGRGGGPRRQVKTLPEAVYYARAADPGTRASLYRWLATGLAGKRDERGFRQAVEAADRLAGQAGPPAGSGFLARSFAHEGGGPVRDRSVGQGLLLLGQPEPAVAAFGRALALVDPGWSLWRVNVRVDTAAAQVLLGEPEAACAGLLEALDLVDQTGFGSVQRIVGVRLGFPEPWAHLACVHELDERLRPAA